FSPALSRITFASGQVSTPSSRAISHAGLSLGFFSTAAFVRSYNEALTGLNLIHFQAGQETKNTIAIRPRITPNIMNLRATVHSPATDETVHCPGGGFRGSPWPPKTGWTPRSRITRKVASYRRVGSRTTGRRERHFDCRTGGTSFVLALLAVVRR